MLARELKPISMHARMRECMHVRVSACLHACRMCVCVIAHSCAWISVYMRMQVYAYGHMIVCVRARAFVRACVRACMVSMCAYAPVRLSLSHSLSPSLLFLSFSLCIPSIQMHAHIKAC